jgi:hypothetical protein
MSINIKYKIEYVDCSDSIQGKTNKFMSRLDLGFNGVLITQIITMTFKDNSHDRTSPEYLEGLKDTLEEALGWKIHSINAM